MSARDGHLPLSPESLGSRAFRVAHGVRLAYVAGSMYKGVASVDLVRRMAQAGLLAYLGAGGLSPRRLAGDLAELGRALGPEASWGVNLLASIEDPAAEDATVEMLLEHGVRRVEAAAFVHMTPALVRYRLAGARLGRDGRAQVPNLVLGKASRPEVATAFLSPPPPRIVTALRESGHITPEEAELAPRIAMADDLCAEADSGGHTDQRPLCVLLPEMVRLRDRLGAEHPERSPIRVGVAGGLGTPEAIAAAFVMRADFVLTGSINQCTVEAGTSDSVKDLLAQAGIQDTAIVPTGDMLEIGAKAQVLKRGLFFPARANRLYELYRGHDSLDQLDERTVAQLENKYFRRTLDDVWAETRAYLQDARPAELARAEADPKQRMAHVFKWYFIHATRLAMRGTGEQRVDYQVPCGPAMGALNAYLRGTGLERWQDRHADDLALQLMTAAAAELEARLIELSDPAAGDHAAALENQAQGATR